ncbi:thioredoxin family protein [Heliorestis acidaminivorans]|uniref:Thioredoxin family protein n=1 Tax=Heliorestis acidaminivorans TaxID=553427 RepID=A0A6I0EZL1_9FIRM|nr:thioredoxin family protein [Heliorestis acidaminivorans]KAB2951178.1 thioredoxin family protein [Heliorestis acidaminivorans]
MKTRGWLVVLFFLLIPLVSGCNFQTLAGEANWTEEKKQVEKEIDHTLQSQEEMEEEVNNVETLEIHETTIADQSKEKQENLETVEEELTEGSQKEALEEEPVIVKTGEQEEASSTQESTEKITNNEVTEGKDLALENTKSTETYIGIIQYYYAPVCEDCTAQSKELEKWLQKWDEKLQQVIIEKIDVGRTDPRIASGEMQVKGLPFFILIDDYGNLATTASGVLTVQDLEQLITHLEKQ